jgi:hypothetical protein
VTKNVGIDLPMPPRRNARQNIIAREEGVDVSGAVSYLEEAERGAIALTNEVRTFATAAKALLEGGLKEHAIALLVQDLCPNAKNGHPIPLSTVVEVLRAAARCGEHLR